ncbi:hypothetical protein V5O48_011235 [Marasmius crinis-equi]|uniref:Uncharacterized protein n=1 Tax=Marasmius crinis-equi TaxID=585013 RepID=A0ABR3F6K9_9AGAR
MIAIDPNLAFVSNYSQNVTILNTVKLLTSAILYGVYLILFLSAMGILTRREGNLKARTGLLAALVVMFILSSFEFWASVHTGIHGIQDILVNNVEEPLNQKSMTFIQKFGRLGSAEQALVPLEAVLGDSIVLWRVWKLWSDNKRVVYLPMFFLLGTTVCSLGFFGCYAQYNWPLTNPDTCNSLEISAFSLSMATNVSGTIVIGYKVWSYRQNVGAFLTESKQKTRVEKVLTLFLESGVVYSVAWIIQLVVVLMDAPKTFSGKVVQQIFNSASIQLVASRIIISKGRR